MSKRIAIMQPYFFPYIGYFQLISAVEQFIFYDDVNFIKGGWIDRNFILANEAPFLFSIPLVKVSSYKKINETQIHPEQYKFWKKKFLRTVQQNYKKAPYFEEVNTLLTGVVESENTTIAQLAAKSVTAVSGYLKLETDFVDSSGLDNDKNKTKEDKILEICEILKASEYINLYGGKYLYDKDYFSKNNIELNFIKTEEICYPQFTEKFHPNLSIIDVMMFNPVPEIKNMLNLYTIH